ncbi:MAG: DsrE/DsrF/DrsH-like family protein [Betaproteobacteria bacterium]|nr:DsrE/DsrF/DrsH-like family protein [Betaproteobacteria bacterium]
MSASKNVSIMCFHDELCQVFNALMTALSLLRNGSRVSVFFGSRGVLAVHRGHVGHLACMPDLPDQGEAARRRMDEMDLPLVEDMLFMLHAEGASLLACPLNIPVFGMNPNDLVEGVKVADPASFYKEVVMQADVNLTF